MKTDQVPGKRGTYPLREDDGTDDPWPAIENSMDIESLLAELTMPERCLLFLHYAAGFTQGELADMCGVHRTTMLRCIAGLIRKAKKAAHQAP